MTLRACSDISTFIDLPNADGSSNFIDAGDIRFIEGVGANNPGGRARVQTTFGYSFLTTDDPATVNRKRAEALKQSLSGSTPGGPGGPGEPGKPSQPVAEDLAAAA